MRGDIVQYIISIFFIHLFAEEQADIAVEPSCSLTVPDSPTKAELQMEITNLKEKLSSLMEELEKKETKKRSRNRRSQKKAKKATILKQLSTILPSESMTFFYITVKRK